MDALERRQKARRRRTLRVRSKVRGTADRPRLSVFRSNRYIAAQLIDDRTGRTLVSAGCRQLEDGDTVSKKEQAEKVGVVLAERAKLAGIEKVVFDRGSYLYHGRVKSLADGARSAGLDF
jgi:large subunit ribosomal protein L18